MDRVVADNTQHALCVRLDVIQNLYALPVQDALCMSQRPLCLHMMESAPVDTYPGRQETVAFVPTLRLFMRRNPYGKEVMWSQKTARWKARNRRTLNMRESSP